MWKEFKPTILFLVKFFVVYFALSALYGFFIQKYDTREPAEVDSFTHFVTSNCTKTASVMGYETRVLKNSHIVHGSLEEQTYDSVWLNDIFAIDIEEGCNGLNIMILFLAFVVAFGGKLVNMLIFIPLGIVFIHLANIGRLLLLSFLNVEWGGRAFHFFHKYGFTAVIYAAVFILWYLWVIRFSGRNLYSKKAQ